jgi:ubiquinone/menaquinone biosynthesis C-methylase UbiE
MKNSFWDKFPYKYVELGYENRKTVLFPAVEKLIPENANNILDFGGGDGGFLESISKDFNSRDIYDPSAGMIEFASHKEKVDAKYTSSYEIESEKYDVVTCIHVVTVIEKDTELKRVFKELYRTLKYDGTAIIAFTHPAFKNNHFSTFHTDFVFKPFDYLEQPEYNVYLKKESPGEYLSFKCYHRSISKLINEMLKSGLKITLVSEIKDFDIEDPDKDYKLPPFMVVKLKK